MELVVRTVTRPELDKAVEVEEKAMKGFGYLRDVSELFLSDEVGPLLGAYKDGEELVGIAKYTGARGKGGASDADAETVGYVRQLFEANDVIWQIAELGKVDAGGGGTVACYMAERDIDTIDAGVPVLSMHAPFETVGKLDCYMTYKGIKAFYEK